MTTNTTALVKQLRNALIDARDDVQAELQRCTELAGRPATDRRLAAQVALALDVDIAIADADKWLAEQPDWRDWMIGMCVSVDVSTGDADEGHRYFGTITEVMDDPGEKHGVSLLVQDAEPNFDPPAAQQPLTTPAVLDLMPTTIPSSMDGDLLWFARAIERAHGIGQPAGNRPPAALSRPQRRSRCGSA